MYRYVVPGAQEYVDWSGGLEAGWLFSPYLAVLIALFYHKAETRAQLRSTIVMANAQLLSLITIHGPIPDQHVVVAESLAYTLKQ